MKATLLLSISLVTLAPAHAGSQGAKGALIVADLPAALYGVDKSVCGSFLVASLGKPVADVTVSSTGLGAMFSTRALASDPSCPNQGASIARLRAVDRSGTKVYYRIDGAAFPLAGQAAATGTVRVASPNATPPPVELPLRLERRQIELLPGWMIWGSGIVVQAGLIALVGVGTAFVGFHFYKAQKRVDQTLAEQTKFEQYMTDERTAIESFFGGVYLEFSHDYNRNTDAPAAATTWRANLLMKLQEKKLWENIPWEKRDQLSRFLSINSTDPPERIATWLSGMFTICANKIAPLSTIRKPSL